MFGVTLDALWRDTNSLIFGHKSEIDDNLLQQVIHQARFIYFESQKALPMLGLPHKKEVDIAWTPPPRLAFKLNVDGSYIFALGSSACGGVIGKFFQGFYCNVGNYSAIHCY